MLVYPHINPIAIQLGPLAIHWYGLMYLFSFVAAWVLLTWRVKHVICGFTKEEVADILFYCASGIILGGRLGYVVFYDWRDLIVNPLVAFQIWHGGMSFHGGLIGVLIAVGIYAHRRHRNYGDITDFIAPVVPVGLAAGRIGNFINGELWGRVTNMPWGMVFPHVGRLPRHPSQLYEFFFEGVVLFLLMWFYAAKPRPRYAVSGLFLVLYGLFRCGLEFFREPDAEMGYVAFGWMTAGQLLSLPMIIIGLFVLIAAYWSKKRCNNI